MMLTYHSNLRLVGPPPHLTHFIAFCIRVMYPFESDPPGVMSLFNVGPEWQLRVEGSLGLCRRDFLREQNFGFRGHLLMIDTARILLKSTRRIYNAAVIESGVGEVYDHNVSGPPHPSTPLRIKIIPSFDLVVPPCAFECHVLDTINSTFSSELNDALAKHCRRHPSVIIPRQAHSLLWFSLF